MTPERWRQVEEIFQAALDLVPEERARYVSEVCANDAGLRLDVESLLSQHANAGELLDEPLYGATDLGALSVIESLAGSNDDEEDPMIGRRLGAYRIVREIGRGGMGAVYEAVRADNEFNKRAAIKLVKRGMDTDFILRRFRKLIGDRRSDRVRRIKQRRADVGAIADDHCHRHCLAQRAAQRRARQVSGPRRCT